MKNNLRLVVVLVSSALLVVMFSASALAEGNADLTAAAQQLKDAIDNDPAISTELKTALKNFVETVEKQKDAPAPTPAMAQRFDKRLSDWFDQKKKELPPGTVVRQYKSGFGLVAPDERLALQLGGRIVVDGRFLNHDDTGTSRTDSFSIRRARFFLKGMPYKNTHFKLQVGFAGSKGSLKNGYIEFDHLGKVAKLRVGQFGEPFSREGHSSSKYLPFMERSLVVDNLVPRRDVGVMVHGEVVTGVVEYAVGLFNGSGSNRKDENSDKEFVGRLVLNPFLHHNTECLQGLSLGVSLSTGRNLRVDAEKQFKTAADTPFLTLEPFHTARRNRYGADVAWAYGPASLQAEWIKTEWNHATFDTGMSDDIVVQGHQITGTTLLTGEQKTIGERLKPLHDFDLDAGGWGAVELALRYGSIQTRSNALLVGIATPGSSQGAHAFSFGLNWYLNETTRITTNVVHTLFEDTVQSNVGSKRDRETAIMTRIQIEF